MNWLQCSLHCGERTLVVRGGREYLANMASMASLSGIGDWYSLPGQASIAARGMVLFHRRNDPYRCVCAAPRPWESWLLVFLPLPGARKGFQVEGDCPGIT
jgi:hypothetical protein